MRFLKISCVIAIMASCGYAGEPIKLGPITGKWVFNATGKPVPPRYFQRGLQTSGLLFYKDVLWSVGDQRSEYPGHLFRIDPKTSRLIGAPIRITPKKSDNAAFIKDYRTVPNHDFEGITVYPGKENTLIGVTEMKRQWIIEIALTEVSTADKSGVKSSPHYEATLLKITAMDFPDEVFPYRGDPNYRIEGIAISPKTKKTYLAYERLDDGLPRIFSLSLMEATSGKTARPRELMVRFDKVPARADKPGARLNINGIELIDLEGREQLIAIARDHERILIIDPEQGIVSRIIDLQLRAPKGEKILWVSPEGIATDVKGQRLWIINDPDSIRGNYRLLDNSKAQGNFADLAPLLFEIPLGKVIGGK